MSNRLTVAKFGGAALKDAASIDHAASLVAEMTQTGTQVIVVVSAMAGVTDQLLHQGLFQSKSADDRDLDLLLATGEQATAALFSMALKRLGVKGAPLLAHQIPILTDSIFQDANIQSLCTKKLSTLLLAGEVPIIAGFQGMTRNGEVTTLGRNGSDTTAVAVAARMAAESCILFKDVDGIYDQDPTPSETVGNKRPTKYEHLTYEAMLALTQSGSQVLHQRSVLWALRYQVPLYVRSIYSSQPGTWISGEPHFTNTQFQLETTNVQQIQSVQQFS